MAALGSLSSTPSPSLRRALSQTPSAGPTTTPARSRTCTARHIVWGCCHPSLRRRPSSPQPSHSRMGWWLPCEIYVRAPTCLTRARARHAPVTRLHPLPGQVIARTYPGSSDAERVLSMLSSRHPLRDVGQLVATTLRKHLVQRGASLSALLSRQSSAQPPSGSGRPPSFSSGGLPHAAAPPPPIRPPAPPARHRGSDDGAASAQREPPSSANMDSKASARQELPYVRLHRPASSQTAQRRSNIVGDSKRPLSDSGSSTEEDFTRESSSDSQALPVLPRVFPHPGAEQAQPAYSHVHRPGSSGDDVGMRTLSTLPERVQEAVDQVTLLFNKPTLVPAGSLSRLPLGADHEHCLALVRLLVSLRREVVLSAARVDALARQAAAAAQAASVAEMHFGVGAPAAGGRSAEGHAHGQRPSHSGEGQASQPHEGGGGQHIRHRSRASHE